ncbi:MAG: metal-dependent hydrolase [Microbacteriaceae bacterium]|nr:MAG: metal-dependent hydrolase [Microbacteriaceae bacterium]
MILPTQDTVVGYPTGVTQNSATVLHAQRLTDARTAVILDATCCHPVDAGWPDQGADRAVLRVHHADADTDLTVEDCVVAATDGASLLLGEDIPVRKGEDGWAFVVAHVIAADTAVAGDSALAEGDAVEVVVDGDYRRALSTGHTACHVASLALNAALAGRWTKDTRVDGLGNPDFDGLAIESSRIRDNGSTDRFRLNKSLRRKGFTTEGLADELAAVQASVNGFLATWRDAGSAVRIERDGERLTDRRYWSCELNGTAVRIPCGGTHVTSLAELGALSVELSIADADGTPVLTMLTDAAPVGFPH